jgi:ATP-dependent Lhr-like helicase
MISAIAPELSISAIESSGSNYITFRMENGNAALLASKLADRFASLSSAEFLVSSKELPIFEKYDEYIPAELLRHAFAIDKLDLNEANMRIKQIKGECY